MSWSKCSYQMRGEMALAIRSHNRAANVVRTGLILPEQPESNLTSRIYKILKNGTAFSHGLIRYQTHYTPAGEHHQRRDRLALSVLLPNIYHLGLVLDGASSWSSWLLFPGYDCPGATFYEHLCRAFEAENPAHFAKVYAECGKLAWPKLDPVERWHSPRPS